jgi:immune inhibitor A
VPSISTRRILPALALAVFSVVGASRLQAAQHGSDAHRVPSAARLLARRLVQPIPYRDLYTLASELKLHGIKGIAHTVRRTSPNYPVGHVDAFKVLSEDTNRFFTMHATIRAETPHLYLYVQNSVKVPDSALQKAAHTFETATYPTDRSYYGSEWRPGIDGDPHITCLVGDLQSTSTGTAGFFSAEDEYPRSVNPYSNEREMFYINSSNTPPGTTDFDLTLAHEFQHMIHWHMHPHEELWLNEGMSILAQLFNKYTDDGMASSFLSEPHTQLNTWNEVNPYPHYGAAYLFLSYLYDHYGRGIVRDLLADKQFTDFALIDDVLRKRHIPVTAHEIFQRWVLANLVKDASIAHGIYAYKALTHTISVKVAKTLPVSYTGKVAPYTADYVNIDTSSQKTPIHLALTAPLTVPIVNVTGSPTFWYANRGDMSDPHMERTFDLTRVHHATLSFSTWYDIEKDYDYAYVEASTDGGKTWTTLHGTDTTRSNPNGASYGYAYTGSSRGWRNESVNLAAYAGHRMQLKFEYVTDDGYTGQGFVVRNIAIPEIGFHDNYTGWHQAGFLPVAGNAVAADWTLDLVLYTNHGVHIRHVPVSAAGTAVSSLDPVTDGIKRIVAVVFATAPKTSVQSSYTLSATDG